MHSTKNHWVLGVCLPSGILKTRKHNVSETGSVFLFWWEDGVPTLLGPLESVKFIHWFWVLYTIVRTLYNLPMQYVCMHVHTFLMYIRMHKYWYRHNIFSTWHLHLTWHCQITRESIKQREYSAKIIATYGFRMREQVVLHVHFSWG
jgi:hypothetical protein